MLKGLNRSPKPCTSAASCSHWYDIILYTWYVPAMIHCDVAKKGTSTYDVFVGLDGIHPVRYPVLPYLPKFHSLTYHSVRRCRYRSSIHINIQTGLTLSDRVGASFHSFHSFALYEAWREESFATRLAGKQVRRRHLCPSRPPSFFFFFPAESTRKYRSRLFPFT